jgi:hypothetical protein
MEQMRLGGKENIIELRENRAFQVLLVVKNRPANSGDIRDEG